VSEQFFKIATVKLVIMQCWDGQHFTKWSTWPKDINNAWALTWTWLEKEIIYSHYPHSFTGSSTTGRL